MEKWMDEDFNWYVATDGLPICLNTERAASIFLSLYSDRSKLRELVVAAEWRDECKNFKEFCWEMAEWQPKVFDPVYKEARKHFEKAETDYYAALAAAKGE